VADRSCRRGDLKLSICEITDDGSDPVDSAGAGRPLIGKGQFGLLDLLFFHTGHPPAGLAAGPGILLVPVDNYLVAFGNI
jgi:hypothetical protein